MGTVGPFICKISFIPCGFFYRKVSMYCNQKFCLLIMALLKCFEVTRLLVQLNSRLFHRAWVKGRKCSYCQIILPFLDTILRDRLKVEFSDRGFKPEYNFGQRSKRDTNFFPTSHLDFKKYYKSWQQFLKTKCFKNQSISQIMLITKIIFVKELSNFSLWIRFQ